MERIVPWLQRRDRWDLSPQTPQWRQNPRRITLPALNRALLFVASHKNGSLAQGSRPASRWLPGRRESVPGRKVA